MNIITNTLNTLYEDFTPSVKVQVEKDIKYLLYLMLIGVMTSLAILHYPVKYPLLKSPIPLNAFSFVGHSYQEPSLDPNIPERTQNQLLIRKIWGKDSWVGLNIARCESGYRTHAVNHNTNGTIDEGVFQVNSVHGMTDMQNAVANISYTYIMFKEQGTNPWLSSKSCWGVVLTDK